MEPVAAPRTFSGRYEVTHLIARGGMAQVYRALDLRLGRHVALKVLFPELSVDRTFVERFRREAQAAANLSHPNVVAVYDWGEDEGTYFIVMELITGTSLATALRTERTLPATRAASIAAQVASALSYAHRHGVVHRDIKPGNVMLTDDGQVKVTDFGIAQAVSTEEGLTMAGSVMGTAAYFSPEQAEGAVVDGRSDVYSLGIVLYEMLAGRTPFVGDSPVAVASMHVRNTPPLLRDLNPAVPADIEAVTMRALAKAPDDRYQSAEDFRTDLLRFTAGQPVVAESVTQTVGVGATSVIGASTTAVLPPKDSTLVVPAVVPLVAAGPAVQDEALVGPPVALMDGPVRDVATKVDSSPQSMWLAAALVVALLVGGFFIYRGLSGPGTLAMPNVIGKTQKAAIKTIVTDGLRVLKSVSVRSKYPPNTVAKTAPPAGTALKPNAIVTLFISSGPQVKVKVPPVVGQQVAAAQTKLSGAKLLYKNKQVSTWSTPVVPGSVLEQSPVAGTTVFSNSPVTLTVLAPGGTYPEPNVVGQLPVTAGATLATYGLVPGTTVSACTPSSSSIAQGNVLSTTPVAFQMVTQGTIVNLTVSTGPCPVPVPNLYGLTPQQAVQQINNANLQPIVTSTCQAGYTSTGFIQSQQPPALQPVKPGSPVRAQVGCTPPSTTTTSTTLPPGVFSPHTHHRAHHQGRFRRHHHRD